MVPTGRGERSVVREDDPAGDRDPIPRVDRGDRKDEISEVVLIEVLSSLLIHGVRQTGDAIERNPLRMSGALALTKFATDAAPLRSGGGVSGVGPCTSVFVPPVVLSENCSHPHDGDDPSAKSLVRTSRSCPAFTGEPISTYHFLR